MSNIDEVIRSRLEKLRTDDNISNERSIEATSSTNLLPTPNKKSAAEQVEELLKQLSGESEIESKIKKEGVDIDAEIRERLNRLRSREGCNFDANSSKHDVSSVDQSQKKIVVLEDCDISVDKLSYEDDNSSGNEDSNDPYDTCALCDGKASLICRDCFNDAYCSKCFNEYHAKEENHTTVPYRK